MSADSGQGDSICTPRRAQKCLFGTGSSSSHRSIDLRPCHGEELSEEDSDIGPMSPLALTDQSPSTTCSSPGREYISPFISPTKTFGSNDITLTWDRLTPRSQKYNMTEYVPPFTALKKITKAARHSPRRKIITTSPKSLPSTPRKESMSDSFSSESMDRTLVPEEIVPETPQRSFGIELQNDSIIETPRKSQNPELRLITPLGSVSKTVLLPKLHRRKSLGTFDMEVRSPERKENLLKRHAQETLASTVSKLLKTDDYCTIPKARASLFQEKNDVESKLKDFTLSTKSFYSNNVKRTLPMNFPKVKESNQFKRRRSLPASGSNRRRSLRDRLGVINAGVFHKIKKPKPKSESKKRTHAGTPSPEVTKSTKDNSPDAVVKDINQGPPRVPEIDNSKRFFKTNGTLKQYNVATVTVSRNIKLKVADGKIALNEKNGKVPKHVHKKPKLTDISFDAADLTVHEPELETAVEQINVPNILKVLEDDWGDDEYDSLECLTSFNSKDVSPLKSVTLPKDVTMSPASELSNMTSTMNIEDPSVPTTFENISFNVDKPSIPEINMNSEKKYYPLFNKGYTADNRNDKSPGFKTGRNIKKPLKWQLCAKGTGGENQYQLDVGQKRFGATQCPECNVIYQLGDPEDENAHLNYHNSINTLKFQGWKKERVVVEDPFTSSRVILVEPGDPKQCWKKVSEVLQVVDRDLGLVDAQLSEYRDKKIYLYIRDKNILGVLVAECIKSAHRMIPELLELDCCTAESTPVKCGVNVVWTVMSHRRQGIATKLVDVLRAHYYYGYVMSMDDIAFSTPTPGGKIFAEKYTKMRNFKVYSQ